MMESKEKEQNKFVVRKLNLTRVNYQVLEMIKVNAPKEQDNVLIEYLLSNSPPHLPPLPPT